MKLKTYDVQNCSAVKLPAPPTITVAKKGMITLCKKACDALDAQLGKKVVFHQDEDRPADWYIELSDSPHGFELKAKSNTKGLYVISRTLSDHILSSLQLSETTRFNMAREPMEKTFLFPIITRIAKSKKTSKP